LLGCFADFAQHCSKSRIRHPYLVMLGNESENDRQENE